MRACVEDAACERAYGCALDCDDPACIFRCATAPTAPAWALGECLYSCSVECRTGSQFGCIGNFAWAHPDEAWSDFHYQVRAQDYAGRSVSGLNVDVCLTSPCDEAASTAYPHEDGTVDLVLNSGGAGFEGFLVIDGELDADTQGAVPIYPYLADFGRPIAQFESWYGLTMIDRAAFESSFQPLVDAPPTPGKGHIAPYPHDCMTHAIVGTTPTFEIDGAETPAFLIPGSGGVYLVGNVAPGTVTLTARFADGSLLSSKKVVVEADKLTSVFLFPQPR
jgi:hypothetical protein